VAAPGIMLPIPPGVFLEMGWLSFDTHHAPLWKADARNENFDGQILSVICPLKLCKDRANRERYTGFYAQNPQDKIAVKS